jgi:hypothetical protein
MSQAESNKPRTIKVEIKRDHWFALRLTRAEKARLMLGAQQAKISMSEYIRSILRLGEP